MISIIICSRKPDISPSLKENIKNTIGVDYEIIAIDNSHNDYSIFSAYNTGVNQSRFPYLCFLHEDVLFRTENWGINLIKHLKDEKTGIIGVAGGKTMSKVPTSWSVGGRCIHIIQHYNRKKAPSKLVKEPKGFIGNCQPVVLLDGVFLAMRKELFNFVSFDETLSGFHGYDFDISAQSILAGYNNYVVYDILLEHFSEGHRDAFYYVNLINIHKKRENSLPLFCEDVSNETRLKMDKIEAQRLGKLIRRMARTGFTNQEILRNAKYYVDVLNTKLAKEQMNFIRLKITFERVFNTK